MWFCTIEYAVHDAAKEGGVPITPGESGRYCCSAAAAPNISYADCWLSAPNYSPTDSFTDLHILNFQIHPPARAGGPQINIWPCQDFKVPIVDSWFVKIDQFH